MAVEISGPPPGVRGSRVDVVKLRRRGRALLAEVGHARSELSIALVDDAGIRALNRSYRSRDRATDVLSFSLLAGEGRAHRGALLGDVVISVETAASQAAARRKGLDDEVLRLLIHGLLHVLGHDHEEDEEARIMEAEERRLRRAIRS